LSASIIVVFDPEGRTGCRILTDREIREFALRTPVSRTRLVSLSARPGVWPSARSTAFWRFIRRDCSR